MPKDNEGKPIEPGIVSRVIAGVRYAVSGIAPDTWFGPGQPTQPVAQEVAGRAFDYPTGFNYRIRPREGEVSFETLRYLADALDLARLAIETRKDQMEKLRWVVRMKDRKAKSKVETIERVRAALAFPDREHPFATWLRMLIEDLLVLDAPCVYPRATVDGGLYAFEAMDGATIKRVLTADGRTPMPPDPAYQQVLKGVPAANYTRDELLYLPRNPRTNRIYGYSPVQQVIITVNLALRRQVHQLQYYTEGTVPEAIVEMPSEWTVQQVREFQSWWDSLLEGNTAARRHMKFVPGPAKVNWTKDAVLKDQMDEWLARVICFAFSLPPTAFVAQVNRATAETSKEQALEEGLQPLMRWAAQLLNTLIEKYLGETEVEFAWEAEVVKDELKAAQVHEIYVRNGILGIDDVLEDLGKEPIGVPRGVMTPAGFVPLSMMYTPPAPTPDPGSPDPDDTPGEDGGEGGGEDKPEPPKPKGEAEAEEAEEAEEGEDEGEDEEAKDEPKPKEKPEDEGDEEEEDEEEAKRKAVLAAPVVSASAAAAFAAPPITKARKRIVRVNSHGADPAMVSKYTQTLANFLTSYKRKVAKAMSRKFKEVAKASVSQKADAILAEVKREDWAFLVNPSHKVMEAVHRRGGDLAARSLQVGDADLLNLLEQVPKRAIAYAEKRAAELVGMKWVDGELVVNPRAEWAISESTREMLRTDVVRALEEGWGPAELREAIEENAAFSESRAMMVSRTEMAFAHVEGNMATYRESGMVERKAVLLGSEHNDTDPLEVCNMNLAAGWIALDAAFPSGDSEPPFHPNCVCDLDIEVREAVAPEDEEEE